MSLRVVQTPESLADIALQADYYACRENMVLAQRFTDAVKATVRLLASHSSIGKETDYAHPKLTRIRLFLCERHSTGISFSTTFAGTQLDIVRIVHGLRNLPRRLLDPPGAE